MIYLSGQTRQFFEHGPKYFGCMFNSVQRTGRQIEALRAAVKWMLDNGAFTGKWSFRQWLFEMNAFLPYTKNCLGVIVPDVKENWRRTLEQFYSLHCMVERRGYKVAFATQDGQPVDEVPWDKLDTLFIGGSNAHKRGIEAERLALEAKRRGKWVHVGRVNSGSSIVKYWPWADSFDGTTFTKHPTQQVKSIVKGLTLLQKNIPQQRKLL